jgi:hypothetical protein
MRRLWKPLVAATVFIAVVLLGLYTRPKEGFTDIASILRTLQEATGQLGASKSYEKWVGYVYTHIKESGSVLNDVKARAFQPTCNFRRDWAFNLPRGLSRPIGVDTPALANAAYKSWLDELAKGNNDCILQLNDFRARFMEPNCNFLNPRDLRTYNKNYKPVFKM